MGKLIFVFGLLTGLFVYFWDIIAGKGEILLGARSWTALILSGVVIIIGVYTWKK